MLNREKTKTIIKTTVKESILNFASRQLGKVPKFQILDLIIPKERRIRSIVGGLETSLGTTLWEPLAKALAQENGFRIVNDNLDCPANMPGALSNTLQTIIEDRKGYTKIYTAESSHDAIKNICQGYIENPIEKFRPAPTGFGVDIWLVKDGVNFFFDTKTVQPNVGTFSKCLDQLLNWYVYFYSKYPQGKAVARIVFPYNPSVGQDFWSKAIGGGRPLEPVSEAWVENEFWDFCSGLENTFQIITESFDEIRESKELEITLNDLLK